MNRTNWLRIHHPWVKVYDEDPKRFGVFNPELEGYEVWDFSKIEHVRFIFNRIVHWIGERQGMVEVMAFMSIHHGRMPIIRAAHASRILCRYRKGWYKLMVSEEPTQARLEAFQNMLLLYSSDKSRFDAAVEAAESKDNLIRRGLRKSGELEEYPNIKLLMEDYPNSRMGREKATAKAAVTESPKSTKVKKTPKKRRLVEDPRQQRLNMSNGDGDFSGYEGERSLSALDQICKDFGLDENQSRLFKALQREPYRAVHKCLRRENEQAQAFRTAVKSFISVMNSTVEKYDKILSEIYVQITGKDITIPLSPQQKFEALHKRVILNAAGRGDPLNDVELAEYRNLFTTCGSALGLIEATGAPQDAADQKQN